MAMVGTTWQSLLTYLVAREKGREKMRLGSHNSLRVHTFQWPKDLPSDPIWFHHISVDPLQGSR